MPNLPEEQPERATVNGATITPYLAVAGAEAALAWYVQAFGARLHGEPIVAADGRIGHAELDIEGAPFMLSEEHPEIGVTAPEPGRGAAVTIHLAVDDVDRVIGATVSAGASLERPAVDHEYGRNGVIRDPFGHRWLISAQVPSSGLRHGEIGYVSLWVPDVDRAAAFFAAVLGWRYAPGSGHQGRQVEGHHVHHGLWGGVEHATLFCCFAVDHVDSAVERVREGGGTAGAAHEEPYGMIAECTDPEGTSFAVFEPPGGTVQGRVPVDPPAEGDLAYVTMEVRDSTRSREFYGSVLGWQFVPGSSPEAWHVEGVTPMVGVSGGHPTATAVPMYRVDDLGAAAGRVRDAGGGAAEPESKSYGISSVCSDDQGTRFYLGQF